MTPEKSSSSDAAFAFVPFVRAYPDFVLKFAVLWGLSALVQALVMQPSGLGRVMNEIATLQSGETDPTRVADAFSSKIAEIDLALLIPGLLVSIVISTMLLGFALRKTVRNEETAGFGLGWGKDETALLLGNLILISLGFAVSLLLGLVVGAGAVLFPPLALLAPVGLILLGILAVGRLGLWGVVTIANQRPSIRETWEISKNGFWTLVGSFVLWAVVAMIVSAILNSILAIVAGALGAATSAGLPPDFGALFTPGWLIYLFASGFISGVVNLGLICVGAFTWHEMGKGKAVNLKV